MDVLVFSSLWFMREAGKLTHLTFPLPFLIHLNIPYLSLMF